MFFFNHLLLILFFTVLISLNLFTIRGLSSVFYISLSFITLLFSISSWCLQIMQCVLQFVLALLPLNPVIFYIYYRNGMLHGAIDTTYVHVVRFKMMNMMYNRRNCCLKWESYLCPVIHKKIEVIVEESRCLLIGCSDGEQFEVVDHQSNSVNLCARTCSCRRWQVYGIPCKHACAAIMQTDTNVHRFIEPYYTVKSYKLTYKESIFPVPDHDKPLDDSRQLRIRPPISKKRPGRPRRKRIESQAWHVREIHCSRCHSIGHNRATCNEVIAD